MRAQHLPIMTTFKKYIGKILFKREGKHVYELYIITELIKKFYKFEIMTQYVLNLRHEAY